MHAVLYTHQLEPITVVDLPMWLWDKLGRGEIITIAVIEQFSLRRYTGDEPVSAGRPKRVQIIGDLLRRRGHETLMLFTADEENALLLRAEFLPGQRDEVRKREHGAFASGFLKALQEFGA